MPRGSGRSRALKGLKLEDKLAFRERSDRRGIELDKGALSAKSGRGVSARG